MNTHPSLSVWIGLRRWIAPAAVSLALWQTAPVSAAPPDAAPPAVAPSTSAADLAQLRALSLERQPALEAYRASLIAAERARQGLEDLRVPTLVRPDLPYRRQQSNQGILAARAQVEKTEWEHRFAVSRLYLTAVFAQEQKRLVDRILDKNVETSLYFFKDVVASIYKDASRRDVKKWDVDQFDLLITVAQARREEAISGRARALAALREAVGLETGTCISLSETATLPTPNANVPCKEETVRLALERRPEMVQAAVGVQVTCLEIKAQEVMRGPRVDTFASGSDIHAIPIPAAHLGPTDYRPGAVTLEMPPQLVGPREARVERASALHQRALAVAEKTRQLIALEAEDAWTKWREASSQQEFYAQAVKKASELADQISLSFDQMDKMGGRPNVDDIMKARTTVTELKVKWNQSRYEVLVALAVLERVTAGGICPGFDQ